MNGAKLTKSEINTKRSNAIIKGMSDAVLANLQQPYDIAICIQVALEQSGFRIVLAPQKEVK